MSELLVPSEREAHTKRQKMCNALVTDVGNVVDLMFGSASHEVISNKITTTVLKWLPPTEPSAQLGTTISESLAACGISMLDHAVLNYLSDLRAALVTSVARSLENVLHNDSLPPVLTTLTRIIVSEAGAAPDLVFPFTITGKPAKDTLAALRVLAKVSPQTISQVAAALKPVFCTELFEILDDDMEISLKGKSKTTPAAVALSPFALEATQALAQFNVNVSDSDIPHMVESAVALLEKCSTKCGETLEFLQKCSVKCG